MIESVIHMLRRLKISFPPDSSLCDLLDILLDSDNHSDGVHLPYSRYICFESIQNRFLCTTKNKI